MNFLLEPIYLPIIGLAMITIKFLKGFLNFHLIERNLLIEIFIFSIIGIILSVAIFNTSNRLNDIALTISSTTGKNAYFTAKHDAVKIATLLDDNLVSQNLKKDLMRQSAIAYLQIFDMQFKSDNDLSQIISSTASYLDFIDQIGGGVGSTLNNKNNLLMSLEDNYFELNKRQNCQFILFNIFQFFNILTTALLGYTSSKNRKNSII